MMRRSTLFLVAGAVILAGTPSMSSAQARPGRRARSTMRIPVTKETTAQVETVTVTRVDTLRVPGPADTVTRTIHDTVTVTRVDTMMTPIRIPHTGAFYAGLGVGGSLPAPEFSAGDKPGWHVEVPIGIDPAGSPLGVRVDLGYSSYTAHDWASSVGSASTMNVDGDLKLRFPAVTPANIRIQPYFLGGATWERFKNVIEMNPNGGWTVGNNTGSTLPAADNDWHSGMGWNVGMGADIGRFFAETRFTRVSGVADKINTVPIVVGITF